MAEEQFKTPKKVRITLPNSDDHQNPFETPKKVRIILPNFHDNYDVNKKKGKFRFKTDVKTQFFKPKTTQSFMIVNTPEKNKPKKIIMPADPELGRSSIIYSEEISREQLKHNEMMKKKRNDLMKNTEQADNDVDKIFERLVQNYDKEAVKQSILERSSRPKLISGRKIKLFDDATEKLINNYKNYFNDKFKNLQFPMSEKRTNIVNTQESLNRPAMITNEVQKDSDIVDENIKNVEEVNDPEKINAENVDCVGQKPHATFPSRKFSTPLTQNFSTPVLSNNLDFVDISPIQRSSTNLMKPTGSRVATPYPRNSRSENRAVSILPLPQKLHNNFYTDRMSPLKKDHSLPTGTSFATPSISHTNPLSRRMSNIRDVNYESTTKSPVQVYFPETANQFDNNNMMLNNRKDTYYF